jgi:hypothetical protein
LSSSPLLDRKIEEITAGLPTHCAKQLHSISEVNSVIIVEYIVAMKSEVNLSDHYRRDVIVTLYRFSKFSNDKPFKDSTRSDDGISPNKFDPESENVRRESKLSVPDRNIEPAVSSIQHDYNKDVAIHHEPEIKGGLLELKKKGLKITHYEERKG